MLVILGRMMLSDIDIVVMMLVSDIDAYGADDDVRLWCSNDDGDGSSNDQCWSCFFVFPVGQTGLHVGVLEQLLPTARWFGQRTNPGV